MERNYRQIILSVLILLLSVSSLKIFNEDWFLLFLSGVLIIFFIYLKQRLDIIFIVAILYWVLVNFIAFVVFKESLSPLLYTFFGTLMRITIAYLILKLSGPFAFYNAERISFWILIIGFIIFLATKFVDSAEPILSSFDLGANKEQASHGGWNILIYANNPWQPLRFGGYAWEAGGAALIIVFSLIITILRDGYRLDYRKIAYIVLLVFTFSTAGYLALLLLILFYILNLGFKKYIFITVVIILILIPLLKMIYNLEFMSSKINKYKQVSSQYERYGYENSTAKRVTRYDYMFLSLKLISKWPLGYGISTNGHIKSSTGVPISGANALFLFLVDWGIIGFIFMLYAINRFIKDLCLSEGISYHFILFLSMLILLYSNPIDRTPLFFGIIFYPFIYNRKLVISSNLLDNFIAYNINQNKI